MPCRATAFGAQPMRAKSHSRVLHVRPSRGMLQVMNGTVSSNDFKTGLTVEIDGAPYKVVEFMHVKPGKGAAFVRSKLKNVRTGNVVDKTFRAGETLQTADVIGRDVQFTYVEGDDYVFMDMETYEETRLAKNDAWAKYLKEGATVRVVFYNGEVIGVEPPAQVELLVTYAEPGVKGNTASGGSKPATLETGAVITVPLFIETGELIKVDTRTDSYLSRAKE